MKKYLFLLSIFSLVAISLMGCKNSNAEKIEIFKDREESVFKSLDDFHIYQIYKRFFPEKDQKPVAKKRAIIIEEYTTEQLNNFGIQSEPVSIDSNQEFSLEFYMDAEINSGDFIFLINDVVVYPENVSDYYQGIDKYVVTGHMDWVYQDHRYLENYNFNFIGLEILDAEYNSYFEGVADYIYY